MGAACDAVQLSWVLRKALGVLSTLEVEERDSQDCFTTRCLPLCRTCAVLAGQHLLLA